MTLTEYAQRRVKSIPSDMLIVVIIMCMILLSWLSSEEAFALSSSFARQGIINKDNGWSILPARQNLTAIDLPPNVMKLAKNAAECKVQQVPRPPTISAVTYLSDGKTLNATLWLSNPFIQPPANASSWIHPPYKEIPWYRIGYYMSIHVHSVYDTGGPDYRLGIEWNVQNGTWRKIVQEFSPISGGKVLSQQYNYPVPLGKNYINLSFDLLSLNYPNLYDILFYTNDFYVNDGRLCRMVIVTSRVYVPPPEFSITPRPSTITLRPGEHSNVELQLKSSANIKSLAVLLANKSADIQTNIVPNRTFISPNGVVTSLLSIKALDSAKARPYTLPIITNFSIPTEAKTKRFATTGEVAYGSNTEFTVQVSNFTVTVLPPFTLQERFNNFYNGWLSPISGIWAFLVGIAAVVTPLIVRKKQKERKSRRQQTHNYELYEK